MAEMILVTGATGLNGSELVRRLSAKGIPSRALVRNPAEAQTLASLPNVEVVEGDMARPDSLTAALRGVERAMLISSSDPTMLEVQSSFIDAARKAGVRHVVKLSGIIPEPRGLSLPRLSAANPARRSRRPRSPRPVSSQGLRTTTYAA